MKRAQFVTGFCVCALSAVVVAVASSLLAGCEEGKGTHALVVTPAYVDLTTSASNITQTFSVTGGLRELSLPLTWSVADQSLGRIGASGGVSASYFANTNLHGVNTIIVKDQYDAEGIATIKQ